jgi:SagB-type dehydrogenase family enzyme
VSLRASGHYLDWDNKPSPFKVYNNLPSIPLPHDFPRPREASLKTINGQGFHGLGKPIDVGSLAEILFFSAGLTRKVRMGSESYFMRAASATGALYPIELYVASDGIPGLAPGVYHFNPLGFSLVKIREDGYSSELAVATDNATASSPLTIAFTSLAWRNAWKYEDRSYRHWFWDSGVIVANLLATCFSEGLPAKLVMGFVDSQIDQLLDLQERKEATVALAVIGTDARRHGNSIRTEISRLNPDSTTNSTEEVDYPVIWETHKASELHGEAEVSAWRHGFGAHGNNPGPSGPTFQLRPADKDPISLSEVVLRRGSARRFAQQPISFEALSTIIEVSTGQIPLDFLPTNATSLELYLIANDVQGLPSGSYYFDRKTSALKQLKTGRLRYVSGYLCLEQLLFSDASVVFFLMTDLHQVLSGLGNRGYRAAQFEAGIRAGKIYLSSYAQAIGASGSTFYDDAVTEFFSPHAKDKSPMIAVGVGVPAYKARPGTILPQFHRNT